MVRQVPLPDFSGNNHASQKEDDYEGDILGQDINHNKRHKPQDDNNMDLIERRLESLEEFYQRNVNNL